MDYKEIKRILREGQQFQKEFEMSEAGMLHKQHEKVFGNKPRFIGRINPRGGDAIAQIKNALATGKPLRGYDDLPAEMKRQFDEGKILID
jgi:hypothetical protein